ncbi:MAG: AarF/ABC1/UbiB kinase family protein [Myxococcales bacterium]|nr:AarF/ABC1/UbiB kinase family protein [Myxococcales bacterium]
MGTMNFLLLAIAGVATIALAALLLLGRSRTLASGRGARIARVGRLSARLWASWLGATLRRTFAGRERRARIDQARRRADAERITETMGHMKGAIMKLGQMLSFISDDIPVEYRAALQSLQASAPPMDFALLRDVAERELGRPLERAFARFDEQPLASASIGQVHRARLPTGEEVVVKIQYPGVAEAIRGDLANAEMLYRVSMMFYPGVEPGPIVEELRGRIMEELDYVNEARGQRAFADLYADHPFIRIPKVHDSHSTARVLTSEYIAGRRFADILTDDAAARSRYAEILYRFVFGTLIRFSVFNCDPHPGNYLFDDQGRVVFLDFGCVKYFPEAMAANWTALVTAHLAGDRDRFHQQLLVLGFFKPEAALDRDALYEFFGYFYEPFHDDRDFTFTHEYTSRSFRMVFKPEGRLAPLAKGLNMPPHFVFANRIQWGVYQLLTNLAASANWFRIESEYRTGAPPSTELGRLDHEHRVRWLEARGLAGANVILGPDGIRKRSTTA